jgi:pimeloyl-ACP methyl ester carboxylesterase
VGANRLEYSSSGPPPDQAATLVLLHEGLGCVGRDFPARLGAATGRGVFAYSRAGYGGFGPSKMPRGSGFMHQEARDVLPGVLDAIGLRRGVLVGHSDGASIAAIYARSVEDHRIRGLVVIAPHFVGEEFGLAEIVRVRESYEKADLRARLARWHDNPDNAFCGWCDPWPDPAFRSFDLTEELAYIRVPILIIQGADDQLGTLRQIEVAREACSCPVEAVILPGIRHAPYRDAPHATVAAIADFVARLQIE